MSISLLSSTSRVQAPFIIVEIAGYQFGVYDKKTTPYADATGVYTKVLERYPNYINELTVNKINGTVNSYTLSLIYAITQNTDPNFLERVFSAASKDRRIKISYGDFKNPTFIYKEEEALITKITSNIDVASSKITYTVNCQSQSMQLTMGMHNFPYRHEKPSTVLKELLFDNRYGLQEVFTGMKNITDDMFYRLVMSDDQVVDIEARMNTTVFDYMNYLVKCMISTSQSNTEGFITNSKYALQVFDDFSGEYGGTYFKVIRVNSNTPSTTSLDVYELTIGYPDADLVTNFTVQDNETYSILYEYSEKIQEDEYEYRINDNGEIEQIFSPQVASNNALLRSTANDRVWWSNMTQFPISGTITLKGLLRPAILMSYVRLNTIFYGRRHISSGLYIITGQTDRIGQSGFTTTLNLTRVGGDTE